MGNQSARGIGNVMSKEVVGASSDLVVSTKLSDHEGFVPGTPGTLTRRHANSIEEYSAASLNSPPNLDSPHTAGAFSDSEKKPRSFFPQMVAGNQASAPAQPVNTARGLFTIRVVPSGAAAQARQQSTPRGRDVRTIVYSEHQATPGQEFGQFEVSLEVNPDDLPEAESLWKKRTFQPRPDAVEVLTAFMSGVEVALPVKLPYSSTGHSDHPTKASSSQGSIPWPTHQQTNTPSIPSSNVASLLSPQKPEKPPVQVVGSKTSGKDYSQSQKRRLRLLAVALLRLRELTSVAQSDIHTLVSQPEALTAYHNACFVLNESPAPSVRPALLTAIHENRASLFIQFGGQGFQYMEELRRLFQTYPRIRAFIVACAGALSSQVESLDAQMLGFYNHGLDVVKWLSDASSSPSAEYLASAPVSYPLICLTQLAHCLSMMISMNITPKDLHQLAKATSGHSQGVVAAVVLSASLTYAHYTELSCRAMQYMFWHGARVQQVFPPVILSGKLLRDASEKPTPMLSVRGLPLATLKQYVGQVTGTFIALVNGDAPPNIVVSGHPVSLSKLQTLLQSIQADPNVSQARIPFSKRKFEFVMSFLPVSVPFHSPLLAPAVPLIMADIQRLGITISAKDLGMPVFSTADGSNFQNFGSSTSSQSTGTSSASSSSTKSDAASPQRFEVAASSAEDAMAQLSASYAIENELMFKLVEMQCVLPVQWAAICHALSAEPSFLVADTHSQAQVPLNSKSQVGGIQLPTLNVTHVIDCGPGGANGIARLTGQNTEGRGVQVMLSGVWQGAAPVAPKPAGKTHRLYLPGLSVLLDTRKESLPFASNWLDKFRPALSIAAPAGKVDALPHSNKQELVEHDIESLEGIQDGQLTLTTKWTRMIGRPPIMVAGMTPSTVSEKFVAAISNAGYVAELAGGGQVNEKMFRQRVQALTSLLKPGDSITVNLLFLNPRLWAFQFPLCCQMRKEGYPIEGVTVAAGIPSADKADEILGQLRDAGIMRVGFKPGSVEAIKQVVAIAQRNPQTTIIVQWTGGRAGGHHSFEDQHYPMLYAYGLLRDQENIVLVAGGGLGDAASALPYFTGEWSVVMGYPAMPFDAVLLGSRVMVAKECPTEDLIKEMIARTPGIKDSFNSAPAPPTDPRKQQASVGKPGGAKSAGTWEDTFEGEAGGILTVLSELGEPIHKIANRGTRFWREMDKRFFSLSKDQLAAALAQPSNRRYIIEHLNADFQKPFFPRKPDGTVPDSVTGMTYLEVAWRMLELMRPHKVKCLHASARCSRHHNCAVSQTSDCDCGCGWLDSSFHDKWRDFCLRTVERLQPSSVDTELSASPSIDSEQLKAVATRLVDHSAADAKKGQLGPNTLLLELEKALPTAAKELVSPEDAEFFEALCRRKGKPVNFVPLIDTSIKMWMKKDSLWYSENLSSVPDHDPERVMVLQGPVSTQFATHANEPVADILNGILKGLSHEILNLYSKARQALLAAPHDPQLRALTQSFFAPLTTPTLHSASSMISSQLASAASASITSVVPSSLAVFAEVHKPSVVTVRLTPPSAAIGSPDDYLRQTHKWWRHLSSVRPEINGAVSVHKPTSDMVRSWRRALFQVPFLCRNKLWLINKVRQLFAPRSGQTVEVTGTLSPNDASNDPHFDPVDRIAVYDAQTSSFGLSSTVPVVEAAYDRTAQILTVTLRHARSISTAAGAGPLDNVATLHLHFSLAEIPQYNPETQTLSYMLVEEDWAARCRAIAHFYSQLWLSSAQADAVLNASPPVTPASVAPVGSEPLLLSVPHTRTFSSLQTITFEAISHFRSVIGDPYVPKSSHAGSVIPSSASKPFGKYMAAPVDYAIVIVWEPMIQALMEGACHNTYGYSDLLALVHLSNEYIAPSSPIVHSLKELTQLDNARLAIALQSAEKYSAVGDHALESEMEVRYGDRIFTTSSLRAVWDEPEGRVITVQARMFKLLPPSPSIAQSSELADEVQTDRVLHVMDVISRFAIRKGSTHHEVEFDVEDSEKAKLNEQMRHRLFRMHHFEYSVPILDDIALAVLLSKKWHSLNRDQVHVGDTLKFELEVLEKLPPKDQSSPRHPSKGQRLDFFTRGTISHLICNHSRSAVQSPQAAASRHTESKEDHRSSKRDIPTSSDVLCTLSHHQQNVLQDPILAYLQRHGSSLRALDEPLANLAEPQNYANVKLVAPSSNIPYAVVSKDVNPIHSNHYAVVLAGLPTTIVHGMYSSAVGRRVIEQVVNGSIQRYKAQFTGMVEPSAILQCKTSLNRLQSGYKLVTLEMRNLNSGSLVLRASAQINQPPTAYFFTGQGSAAVGMGMELYQTSAPTARARRVWDEADQYLSKKYGFSILDIVQSNPKRLKISFAGATGADIRHNWAALAVHNPNRGPNEPESRALYPGAMDPETDGIEFHSEEGLLYQTQFQQPAILLAEKSAFEDLRSKGAIVETGQARYAGHSLGEYGAIACMVEGRGLSVPQLAEVVFLRGLTMQSAVPRDEQSRSRYGMVAVSPSRVGPWFADEDFFKLIDALQSAISKMPDLPNQPRLLQIVNYNVKRTQYVVAGELTALEAMRLTLDALFNLVSSNSMPLAQLAEKKVEIVQKIINDSVLQAESKQQATSDGFLPLQRGKASIPLSGIDVPFHSRLLLGGVASFRKVLQDTFSHVRFSSEDLIGKYIPNLVGIPFSLSRSFVDKVFLATGGSGESLKALLQMEETKDEESWKAYYSDEEHKQSLCRLLLIELLAYQFASPVQWIQTQDELIAAGVRRCIEVGPSPVLIPMFSRSYAQEKMSELATSELTLLWSGRDIDSILFKDETSASAETDEPAPEPKQSAPVAAKAEEKAPPPVVTAAPVAAPTQPSSAVSAAPAAEIPFSALHSLRVIVSQKLKMPFAEVTPSKNIKALCGGKSALQNEILGDLSAEFATEPEGADEMPLQDLGTKLGAKYSKPGKILTGMTSRFLQVTLPGGFGRSQVVEYLRNTWGLSATSSEGVIAHSVTFKQTSRLGSEGDAKSFIDSVVTDYAQQMGVNVARGGTGPASAAGSAAAGGAVMVVDGKQLVSIKQLLKKQAAALQAYLQEGDPTTVDSGIDRTEGEATSQLLSIVAAEHGTKYVEGIKPIFDSHKIRSYDSAWNWARHDLIELILQLRSGHSSVASEGDSKIDSFSDKSLAKRLYLLANRASPTLLAILKSALAEFKSAAPSDEGKGDGGKSSEDDPRKSHTANATAVIEKLAEKMQAQLSSPPVYKEYRHPSLPRTKILENGEFSFTFTSRYPEFGFEGYVADMLLASNPNRLVLVPALDKDREITSNNSCAETAMRLAMSQLASRGVSFAGKTALITGAGEGSIGLAIARCMLMGGAHVIVTTSRAARARWEMYRQVFREYACGPAKLTVLPFNGASQQDVNAVVDALFEEDSHKGGLGVGAPDFVLPFAAMSENGRDISMVDEQSELAHRTMLTNVVRLIGAIKARKTTVASVLGRSSVAGTVSRNTLKHTLVVLPLSPNHGLFGGDGLYSESKLALETLFNKWRSEGWGVSASIGLVGAEIGWTRGTGLMSTNDLIAQDIEAECHLRTFDTTEMAFNCVALMAPPIVELSQRMPLKADLSGGFATLGKEGLPAAELRAALMRGSAMKKAVYTDDLLDRDALGLPKPPSQKRKEKSAAGESAATPSGLPKLANLQVSFPPLPAPQEQEKLRANRRSLEGMLDLRRVPVIVGFGEVGPWGSARTRWEYECWGRFSAEGAIELARSMGLVKFHSGAMASMNNEDYVGWVDAKSGQPVADGDIAAKYHADFMAHCGIRQVEPALFDEYDPQRKMFLQQVALETDIPPFEVSSDAELQHLQKYHGGLLAVEKEQGRTMARLKKGAVIFVPKSVPFDREVAGQIPSGWNAIRYGIPKDIQVDPVTLYALGATIDAFISAGITDPYELYQYVHISEVGNSIGGGMGGMKSLKGIFRHRMLDKGDLSSDLLQETFINTTPAWVNMLLLSSSGPIKTPVAACATAATSVEIGVETIRAGKARVMLTGGFEDFGEEGSYEFGQMKATSSSIEERKMGREPDEMCRPAATTRAGFMESQGAGIQIVMSADLALTMGLPIYAILAGSFTATDRQGRSVPAPGQGILTTARELKPIEGYSNPLLDIDYRQSLLEKEKQSIRQWLSQELTALADDASSESADSSASSSSAGLAVSAAKHARRQFTQREAERRLRAAQATYGQEFYVGDSEIAPLRGCLAVWGLNVSDLEVVSFHGTGTKANDKNESEVVDLQMKHLGRPAGQPLFTIFQKWLTGHPKGAAAGWMLNGVIQSMLTGHIPGNRNLDNVDPYMTKFEHLLYSDRTLSVGRPLRAAYLHSFGFGQAGAELVVVNPSYLFDAVNNGIFGEYSKRRELRNLATNLHFQLALNDRISMMQVKNRAPYGSDASEEKDQAVYLDPSARAVMDSLRNQYAIPKVRNPETGTAESVFQFSSWDLAPRNLDSASSSVSHSSSGASIKLPTDSQPVAAAIRGPRPPKSRTASESSAAFPSIEDALSQVPRSPSPSSGSPSGLGVDVEEVNGFENKDDAFLQRNFTSAEIAYCEKAPHRAASLAGRWCAKEAVVKALTSAAASAGQSATAKWTGGGAPLKDIEIAHSAAGSPTVKLSGHAQEVANAAGIRSVVVSISHTATHAVAQAIAYVGGK